MGFDSSKQTKVNLPDAEQVQPISEGDLPSGELSIVQEEANGRHLVSEAHKGLDLVEAQFSGDPGAVEKVDKTVGELVEAANADQVPAGSIPLLELIGAEEIGETHGNSVVTAGAMVVSPKDRIDSALKTVEIVEGGKRAGFISRIIKKTKLKFGRLWNTKSAGLQNSEFSLLDVEPAEHGEQIDILPAPTVDSLIHQPDEMSLRANNLVMVVRNGYVDRTENSSISSAEADVEYIEQHSETELMVDLQRKCLELQRLFVTYGGDSYQQSAVLAGRMAKELKFIGSAEFNRGINDMARLLADRLLGTESPLYVLIKKGRSPALIYQAVSEILHQQDSKLADRLLPVEYEQLYDPRTAAAVSRSGIAIIDDWSASGEHMNTTVSALNSTGIPTDAQSIYLICASDRHLREGFYGVKARATYTYPDEARDDSHNNDTVTFTGTNSDNDFGFRNTLDRLYRDLDYVVQGRINVMPESALNLPQPLLARIARIYRESDLPSHSDKSATDEYHRRCQEHTRFIETRLEQSRQALET